MESLDTQKETKTEYPVYLDYIAIPIEDEKFPKINIIFKGQVRITYNADSKELLIITKNLDE